LGDLSASNMPEQRYDTIRRLLKLKAGQPA
jgi:hypothetical protein